MRCPRFPVLTLAFAALIAIVSCGGPSESETVLATTVRLGARGNDVKPALPFRTVSDRSLLLLELPASGAQPSVGGFLTTMAGERVALDDVAPVEHGGRTYIRLRTKALDDKRGATFSTVTLWAEQPVTAGKLVWFSYDPRRLNDAAAWPEALK